MTCIVQNEIIDLILNSHKNDLNIYFEQYRNHVYRVYNFAFPHVTSQNDINALSIASAFHDLGIWTNDTFDYLKPSIALAKKYAEENNLDIEKIDEIETIIAEHHKLTGVKTLKLAETFRQADLVDLTLGLIRHGMKREEIKMIRKTFPNKGFHLFLLKLFLKNLITNPLNPLPMYKL